MTPVAVSNPRPTGSVDGEIEYVGGERKLTGVSADEA